jgi:hypothetical protein
MQNMKSLLGGAAVAALLISAGGADAGQDRTWTKQPTQNFQSRSLMLDHVVADVTIGTSNGSGTSISIQGPRYLVDDMHVQSEGGVLHVSGPENSSHNFSVWDVSKWFDYSDVNEQTVKVTLFMPRGSDVVARHMIGDLNAGDLGHVDVESVSSDMKIGHANDAKIKVAGSGDISISGVATTLSLDVAGSGNVHVGPVGNSANISVAGSGDTTMTGVGAGLTVSIAGSGNLDVGTVNGPVSVSTAGSGDVKIAGGTANPLKVSMVGGGDLDFGGAAVNPSISALGSGDVWIKSYTGHLSSSGMADVHIGDGDDHHAMRIPPIPPVPPVPAMPGAAPVAPVAPPAPVHKAHPGG